MAIKSSNFEKFIAVFCCSSDDFRKSFFNQEFGLAFKILGKKLHKYSALGVGIDLGILKNYYGINFAAVVKNFPSSGLIWDDGKIESTMTKLSIGSHYNKLYKNLPFSINLMSRFDFDSNLNETTTQIDIKSMNNLERMSEMGHEWWAKYMKGSLVFLDE